MGAGRSRTHHAFGDGIHSRLGVHLNLARLELEVIFHDLAQRLDNAELAGPVQRLRSSFVGGIKHMLIRYRILSEWNRPEN